MARMEGAARAWRVLDFGGRGLGGGALMRSDAYEIGVACEDAVDFQVVKTVFDALTREEASWNDENILDDVRRFVGWEGGREWSPITKSVSLPLRERRGHKLHGRGQGPDFLMFRLALIAFDRRN